MTELLLLVIALGILGILVVVLRIAADLRTLRVQHIPDMLASLGKLSRSLGPIHRPLSHDPHKPEGLTDGDCVVWEWLDGCWQVLPESVPAGDGPGVPPAYPGAFSGERVKTSASRRVL
jgi:hypothetical protein